MISLLSMENQEIYHNDDHQMLPIIAGLNGDKLCSIPNGKIEEIRDIYEEVSYHELRCISNDEFMDYEDEFDRTRCRSNGDYSHRRFYRKFSDNSFPSSRENTDDQLFIEIIKEDIDLKTEPPGKCSILDSISFNNDQEHITEIKIIEAPHNRQEESPYVPYKKPELKIPPELVKIENRPRKPMALTNYRNLITEAINSSPDKRMILTDIYKWIMDNVPFFKEARDKKGWKNCVRHTLSVNDRFIRIKNRTNVRSSYWTVSGGDNNTKLAAWKSEIFKPEERKRPWFKRRPKNTKKSNNIDTNTVRRKRGRPPKNPNKEKSKTSNKVVNKKIVNKAAEVSKYQTRLRTKSLNKKDNSHSLRIKAETKNIVNTTRTKKKKKPRKKQTETLRRSNRKKVARKTWKF